MSVTIPQDIVEQAKILNAAGDLVGAYQLLADAGDNDAAAALGIVEGVPDIMGDTVKGYCHIQLAAIANCGSVPSC